MKPYANLLTLALLGSAAAADTVGGDAHRKLYVLHGEGNGVSVVDVASHEVIKEIEVGEMPHGVAAPDSQDLLYVTIEGEGGLVVIDTRTDTIVKEYESLGVRPHENDITSDGSIMYMPFLGDGVYRVFDTEKGEVTAEIPTDGFPHNVVISPDDRFAYLSPMDLENRPVNVVRRAGYPTSENHKIYVADLATHKTVATIEMGDAPRPIAVNPNGKFLYANRDGFQGIFVIDLEQREVVAKVPYTLTEREKAKPSRAHGIWVTPGGEEVWTCDVNHGIIFCYDVTQMPPVEVARVETNSPTYWLEGTPDGKTLYAASPTNNLVSVIDIASRKMTQVIPMPDHSGPKRMLVVDAPKP